LVHTGRNYLLEQLFCFFGFITINLDSGTGVIKSTEVKAQSSTSAKSINEDDTCISLFATDEYVPALKADETREEMTYEPTPKHILQLKTKLYSFR
jgi:hypothetical protein